MPATWGRWHVWGQDSLDLGPAVPPFEAVLPTLSRCGRIPACLVPATSPHTQDSWAPDKNSSQELPSEEYKRIHLPLKHHNSHRQHQSQTGRDWGDPRPSGDLMHKKWLRFQDGFPGGGD